MLVKVEYRKQIHKIDLLKIRDLRELEQTVQKCFTILPPEFCLIINDPDNTIMDNNQLSNLKKSNRSSVKLQIKDVRSNQSDLISVQSDRDSSFSKLQESIVSQIIPVRQSIEIIRRHENPAEWRQNGSIFITSRYENVQTFKEETTQYVCVQTSQVVSIHPQNNKERQSMILIRRGEDEVSQLTGKMIKIEIDQPKKQEKKQENKKEQVIFDNLQCDICFEYPIKGPVFKCLICEQFDLCQNCQAIYHHFHPTLQMTKPSHYPTCIRIVMPEPSNKIQQLLEQQTADIKKQRRPVAQLEGRRREEVDPSTLKSRVIRQPSFLASLLGVRCNN